MNSIESKANMCEHNVNTDSVAVCVKDLYFSFSKSDPILNGIDLNVPKATIYGLLGPSGCGKTTLLKCILGRIKSNSGDINIFGGKPHSKICHIPGAGVGYMPQELGLYYDFTIEEILNYFGRIFAMTKDEIKEKIKKLIELLELPKKSKLIGKISGGQQRRVSLACALIHCPPLLILDEPTVGTDPLLRQTIWTHLVSLCKSGLTIILTTHYIDEARTADIVAFMRTGKILAEDNPNVLLDKYLTNNLEEVFLKLCHLEGNKDKELINDKNMKCDKNSIELEMNSEVENNRTSFYENHMLEPNIKSEEAQSEGMLSTCDSVLFRNDINKNSDNINKNFDNIIEDQSLSAVCHSANNISKTSDTYREDPIGNGVYVQIITANDCNNEENKKLKLNTCYEKHNQNYDCSQKLLSESPTINIRNSCFQTRVSALLRKNFRRLSRNWGQLLFFVILPAIQLALLMVCISGGPSDLNLAIFDEELLQNQTHNNWGQLFLNCVDNKTFNFIYYNDFDSAFNSVESGQSWAMLDINKRFSTALRLRHLYANDADEETLEESQIRIHIDWSNQAIGVQIERYLYEAMKRFAEEMAKKFDINPDTIKIPMRFEQPVYGNRDASLRDFALPGCFVLLAFFSTASVTAHLILDERRDGQLERSLVAGITAFEFLLSHALTQFLILCLQISLLILMPAFVMDTELTDNLILVIALALSQGFCGIVFGLMISAICSDIIYAAMFTIFIFFVSIIIGGVFWPIENMPTLIRSASNLMPSTLSIQSMRSILYRDWNLCYYEVYIGFIVTYVWFAIFVIIALIALRRNF